MIYILYCLFISLNLYTFFDINDISEQIFIAQKPKETSEINSLKELKSSLKSNSLFIIKSNINLNNEVFQFPSNVTLRFDGGSFFNGYLKGNFNIESVGNYEIFKNVEGDFTINKSTPQMFGADNYGERDSYRAIQKAIDHSELIEIPSGIYKVTRTIRCKSNRRIVGLGYVKIISEIPKYSNQRDGLKDGSIINTSVFAIRGEEYGYSTSQFYNTSGDFLCTMNMPLIEDFKFNRNTLVLKEMVDMKNLSVGDYIHIGEGLGYWHNVVSEIAQIKKINNNTLTLTKNLRFNYSTKENSIGNFFKLVVPAQQPGGTIKGYPDISKFYPSGIRKIYPISNVSIENITIDCSSDLSDQKTGIIIMLSKNIILKNINFQNSRLWTCDSQDITYDSCIFYNYNNYLANGSNNIRILNCNFHAPFQIEEGASNILINKCSFDNTSATYNSVIAHVSNIKIDNCTFRYNKNNVPNVKINTAVNLEILNSNFEGGSPNILSQNTSFDAKFSNNKYFNRFKSNKDITKYYNSQPTIVNVNTKIYSGQSAIYNESKTHPIQILNSKVQNGVGGKWRGDYINQNNVKFKN
jgi:hypothetical protein